MKKHFSFISFLLVIILTAFSIISAQNKFYVDLNDRHDDLFKVTLIPKQLSLENKIYQFAATAPGTYQIMDIGRYVKSFKAFDAEGKEIPVNHLSLNQWEISDPTITRKIIYEVAETWDTPMDKNPVFPMCGTSIENDYVMINGHCVFGYFHGQQKHPVEIKIIHPDNWSVGTSLTVNADGYLSAPDFDTVVDSPILLGNLSKASTTIENTVVDVYTYSKTGLIKSENILMGIQDILGAASQFIMRLPVERYVFLFNFEDFSAGAWEHNYSSIYVFKEDTLDETYTSEIRSTAAHEFFHIITPLHIHSELISNFNYEKPVMSQHLWLYEGVTEWASDIMQMRDYLISIEDLLVQIQNKLTFNDGYDQTLSLTELSVNSTEKQDQYINIYNKGAVVAALLDIRLLELSNCKKGLREVVIDLLNKYGTEKSFDEKTFFKDFTEMTFPEVETFLNKYVIGTEKLPVKEYFEKLGVEYIETAGYDSSQISLGFGISFVDNNLVVANISAQNSDKLKVGDILYKAFGEEITLQTIQTLSKKIIKLKVGEKMDFVVKRGGEEIPVTIEMQPRAIRHKFRLMDNPSKEQLNLRNAWSQNFLNYKMELELR